MNLPSSVPQFRKTSQTVFSLRVCQRRFCAANTSANGQGKTAPVTGLHRQFPNRSKTRGLGEGKVDILVPYRTLREGSEFRSHFDRLVHPWIILGRRGRSSLVPRRLFLCPRMSPQSNRWMPPSPRVREMCHVFLPDLSCGIDSQSWEGWVRGSFVRSFSPRASGMRIARLLREGVLTISGDYDDHTALHALVRPSTANNMALLVSSGSTTTKWYDALDQPDEHGPRRPLWPETRMRTSPIPLQTAFVGRDYELRVLRGALEQIRDGQGQCVLIAGEPGIGKTRLVEEFARVATERGVQGVWGRCWEGDGAPSLWPWMQILRSLIERCSAEDLTAMLGTGAAVIAQVVPELQQKLSGLSAMPSTNTEDARFRFFDCLTSFLRHLGQHQPLVLCLDDLHWADPSSLSVLQFLIRTLSDMQILVVGTYRDAEVTRTHPLAATLGELARDSSTLTLQGLSEAELAQVVEVTSGSASTTPALAALYEQTQGNPFFAKEILQLATSSGHPWSAMPNTVLESRIPTGVRETIRRRVARLSPAGIGLLRLSAVIGRDFGLDVLQQQPSVRNASPSGSLLQLLNEAWEARFIEPVPGTVGCYRFVHALVRETLYEDLSLAERVHYHSEIGDVIERLQAAHLEPYFAVLADHFEKAVPAGEAEKALRYRRKAGDAAMALFAYEEAVIHYQRAQQLLTLVSPDDLQHCQLLLHLGDAQHRAGTINEARATYLQAATLARRIGAHEGHREAAHALAQAALGIGGQGDLATRSDRIMTELLDEALQVIGAEDPALRVRLLSRLTIALYFLHAPERRESLSQEAVTLARRWDDPAILAEALAARYYALWGPDHVEERLAIARETVRLGEMTENKAIVRAGHVFRVLSLLEVGEIVALDADLQIYTELTTELRQPYYLWRASSLRTMRALLAGEFTIGEQLAQETLAYGQRAQTPNALVVFAISLFTLRREQGRLLELEESFRQFVERYPAIPAFRTGLAYLYSELGREPDARREFERLAADGFSTIPRDGNWLNAYEELAQTCVFLGDVGRAAQLYDALLPYAGLVVVVGFADGCQGVVSQYLGQLATTMARWEEAQQHFTAALAMSVRMGARPLVAHTQYDYACMLLARHQLGDGDHARTLLDAADTIAQTLGMTRLQENISGHRERLANMERRQPPSPSLPVSPHVFRFDGTHWQLAFAGRTISQRDVKGLRYIAFLLQHPTQEWHVVDLLALTDAAPPAPVSATAEVNAGHLTVRRSGVGERPMLDAQARAAYRRRLEELREELQEAEAWNDAAQVTTARDEMEMLAGALATAYGVVQHARGHDESVEKARKAVTNRIRSALAKLQTAHPNLWQHLFPALRTGTFCSYQPVQPTQWMF